MSQPYFKKDNSFIYLDAEYMEFYIPSMFFDETKRYAIDYYSYIETLGLFYIGVFEKGDFKEFRVMKQPYDITIYVYDSDTQIVELPNGPTLCKIVKYTKGTKVMNSKIIQDAQSSSQYLDMMMAGKIPSSIPYDVTAPLFQKNKMMNKVNFGVRPEVEEMVISLNYRNPNDLSEPFSVLYGSDLSVSPLNYELINSRQICQYASTFSSITFEDIDSMITTSVNRSREHKKDAYSPVEKIIKM